MDELDKITKATRRRYEDACAAAHALDLVGERWALLVMRELMLGPRRFTDLRAGLPGLSANVLTQRLGDLEHAGILVRRRLPPPANVAVYALTDWGVEAEPILQVMGRWAARSPRHDPTMPISVASLVLSLRTMFDAERAQDYDGRLTLRMNEESYLLEIRHRALRIERQADEGTATASLEGMPASIAAFIYGGIPLRELENTHSLHVAGDRRLIEALPPFFPLPTKASAPLQPGKS